MLRLTDNEKERNQKTVLYSDEAGRTAYMRTALFMLMKCVHDLYTPAVTVWLEFNYHGNYFIDLEGQEADRETVESLKAAMRELSEKAVPVRKKSLDVVEAIRNARKYGFEREAEELSYRLDSQITFYSLDDYYGYFTGDLLENTSCVDLFDLVPEKDGFFLVLPDTADRKKLNALRPVGRHFECQLNSQLWADDLGVSTLAELNSVIKNGKNNELILMQEAVYEKKIGDVAERIVREGKKFVFLAGPSSSGKTTTAHRLAVQLSSFGIHPEIISADDYYKNLEDTPLLPDGRPDIESVRALDTELFNQDMLRLLSGEGVELPSFNFITHKREYRGKRMRLGLKKVLIIEGIHCLNPMFSEKIPEDKKFRLYVSALTPLSVNPANVIPTSDCRLLRRIVRDARTRGYTAADTIRQWKEVRAGEEENIFPYQDNADAVFNSAMIYELSALKTYAEPLLFTVNEDEPEYAEARRLLKFMSFVLATPTQAVPASSVLREFIGGSSFE